MSDDPIVKVNWKRLRIAIIEAVLMARDLIVGGAMITLVTVIFFAVFAGGVWAVVNLFRWVTS